MMSNKKILFFFILFEPLLVNAQNIQLHYDFGEQRKMFTSTIEMFKPDKYGNTFFFVDFDYGSQASGVNGIDLAYWEIARVLNSNKMRLGLHLEYNGGFGRFALTDTTQGAFRINDAFLTGIDYSWNAQDYSKGISLKVLYKYITDKHNASFQFTGVWYWHLFNKKLTFSGFIDFWREDSDFNFDGEIDAKYILLSEPQLWYNFNTHFSAGGEVELSNNFGGNKGIMANPTLALKYIF